MYTLPSHILQCPGSQSLTSSHFHVHSFWLLHNSHIRLTGLSFIDYHFHCHFLIHYMSIRRMIPSLFFTLFIAFTSLAVTIPPFSIASHDSALKFRRLDGHYYAVITPRTGELLNSVQQDLQVAAQRFGQLLDNFIPDNWPLKRGDSCPRVWKRVSRTLASMMVDKGECNNLARAAVRAAFHDCFNGACDGSLFLAGELSRQENLGLADGVTQLGKLAQRFKVGVADMFQFAGGTCSVRFVWLSV